MNAAGSDIVILACERKRKLTRRDQTEKISQSSQEDSEPSTIAVGVPRDLLDESLERYGQTFASFVVTFVESRGREESFVIGDRSRCLTRFLDLRIDLSTKVGRYVEFEGRLSGEESVDRSSERSSEEHHFVVRSI